MNNVKITGKGPINIALIKYWGKDDEENIIPSNNSISLTLDMNEFYTQTTAELDIECQTSENILILNDKYASHKLEKRQYQKE
jgi:diphosphomevalonate decarboxylase